MKLRRLATAAAACAFIFVAAFGAYAMNTEKYSQGISAASYDSVTLAEYADQIAAMVNSERAAYGLDPVKVSPKLSEAANTRARELQQSFSHTRPDGTSCFTAISELGITYRAAAENIAYGQKNPESVMKAWMNSSGHRANILNESMEYIGVGAVYSNGVYYWSQFFAVSSSLSSGSYLPGENDSYETELPAETTAPEAEPEPEETTVPTEKPEPAETTVPTEKPEPAETTAPAEKPEPAETTVPTEKPKPEETAAPEIPSQPQQTEAEPEPEAPCVTGCEAPDEGCVGPDCENSADCGVGIPCVTECDPSDPDCTSAGGQNSSDCTASGSCPTTGNQDPSDCTVSGNCPTTGNQNSSDCTVSGSCPTTGNQNSSSCPAQDILSSIIGSSGSCNNNNSSSGNCFGDILSWIGGSSNGSCNSSAGNSSGSCNSNNGSNSGSCNNGNSYVFGTQSSSGCPITDILGSMFR